jgi:hypothetical protein
VVMSEDRGHSGFRNVVSKLTSHTVQKSQPPPLPRKKMTCELNLQRLKNRLFVTQFVLFVLREFWRVYSQDSRFFRVHFRLFSLELTKNTFCTVCCDRVTERYDFFFFFCKQRDFRKAERLEIKALQMYPIKAR